MKNNAKKTAILIVSFNSPMILNVCIKSIYQNDRSSFDLFIIDNGSKTDNRKIVKKYDNANYYQLKKNYFISKAINLGFKKFNISKKYDFFIIAGCDVFFEKESIKKLTNFMIENEKIAISGPAHHDIKTNKLISNGVSISSFTSKLINYVKTFDSRLNHFHSCYIVKTKVFEKVNGFDEILFPMVYEEPDLGERILKIGYKIEPCFEAMIKHPIGENRDAPERNNRMYSNRAKAYFFTRNRIIYMSLHSNFLQFLFYLFSFNIVFFIYYLLRMENKLRLMSIIGFFDGLIYSLFKSSEFIAKRNKLLFNI